MSWKILTPLLSISFLICACGGGQAGPESAEKVANEISGPEPALPVPAEPVVVPALPVPAEPVVVPALSVPAEPVVVPALSADPVIAEPVIEKSSIKATIYFNGLVDVKELSASALSTWKCGGGKKGNLAGYAEGESEEVSNQRYAKRSCGIEYSTGAIPIFFRNADQTQNMFMHVSYKETKIKILPSTFKSNLESVKVTIREDLNRLSYPIVPENNDPWPHIQIRLNDHLNEDIQIKGTFLDPEGKEGEFNATIKVHSISEEVYERWRKPEVSPVRVEFEKDKLLYAVIDGGEKKLYEWKCPSGLSGNLENLGIKPWPTQEARRAALENAKAKQGCGLIEHKAFIPNWIEDQYITEREFRIPTGSGHEIYEIQILRDLKGYDDKVTSGIFVGNFPRGAEDSVSIPIEIVDDQDRASISYLELEFDTITKDRFQKWSYKGD